MQPPSNTQWEIRRTKSGTTLVKVSENNCLQRRGLKASWVVFVSSWSYSISPRRTHTHTGQHGRTRAFAQRDVVGRRRTSRAGNQFWTRIHVAFMHTRRRSYRPLLKDGAMCLFT
ncbi:hypothetical protein H310_12988 [Aphanomyces invadans]|uniref:Uncharacterized protein n=1 Tax=Aphanomyces invadans TaxID=157072 RepID=A0A024TFD9_9STRA|nr:hypothetical protein H310_12988 [Aphanomyces invadans]ETV92758.1 hypothetical protein H310_12988 [Aphanomyces invadans]|eukprot:XP_008878528.1 hypothetical protein H310_12988 [Aphanomyces invadans]